MSYNEMFIEQWTNLECAGGFALRSMRYASCTFTEAVDGNDSLRLSVPRAIGETLEMRATLRVIDALGTVREFRVRRVTYSRNDATCDVECAPILLDLSNAGLVVDPFGSVNVGASLRPVDWVNSYVLANAAASNVEWLVAGTLEFNDYYTLSFTAQNRLELLRTLEQATGGELRLRRVGGTAYAIDLVVRIGANTLPVRAIEGRNLLDYQVSVDDTQIRSRVYPLGVEQTDGGLATIADAAWRVGSIIGAGPFWVQLSNPSGGLAPIQLDGQVTGKFLRLPNATTVAIVGSRAIDSAVQLASVFNVNANDIVQLLETASGQPYVVISNPQAVATFGGVTVPVRAPEIRGERNIIPNSRFAGGTTGWQTTEFNTFPIGTMRLQAADVAGTLSAVAAAAATSISVTGFPALQEISLGERLDLASTQVSVSGLLAYTNTSGVATVTISASPVAFSVDQPITLFDSGGLPYADGFVSAAVAINATSLSIKGLVAQKNIITNQFIELDVISERSFTAGADFINVREDGSNVEGAGLVDLRLSVQVGAMHALSLAAGSGSVVISWVPANAAFAVSYELTQAYDGGAFLTIHNIPAEIYYQSNPPQWLVVEAWADAFLPFWLDPRYTHSNSRNQLLYYTVNQPAFVAGVATVTSLDNITIPPTQTNDAPAAIRRITSLRSYGGVESPPIGQPGIVLTTGTWTTGQKTLSITARDAYRGIERPPGQQARVASIASGDSVRFVGETVFANANVVLNASGVGTIPVSPAIATDKLIGTALATRRATDLSVGDENSSTRGLVLNRGFDGAYFHTGVFTVAANAGTLRARAECTMWAATGDVVAATARLDIGFASLGQIATVGTAFFATPLQVLDPFGRRTPIRFALETERAPNGTVQSYRILLRGGANVTQATRAGQIVLVRTVMVWVGTETGAPYTETSHANALFQRGLTELIRGQTAVRQVRVRYLDLVRMSGGQISDTAPVELGAAFTVESLGLTFRVVSFTFSPDTPESGEVVLDVIRPRLTSLV